METLGELLKIATPSMAFAALAAVGLKVIWDYLRGKRNGRNGGRDVTTQNTVQCLGQDKLDRLETRFREDMENLRKDAREMRDRLVKVETHVNDIGAPR